MTAEIAIMNKNAVALAADSAVTIETGAGTKIFNTAEKLFSLSKYHPVGIMIYDSASIMGVPWESVIKVYRVGLGKKSFPTLRRYAEDFLAFLSGSRKLFPQSQQVEHFLERTAVALRSIVIEVKEQAKALIAAEGTITDEKIDALLEKAIRSARDEINSHERLPHLSAKGIAAIKRRYAARIRKVQDVVFEKLPVSAAQTKMLVEIAIGLSCRKVFPFQKTGIVVAGFGESEIYPSFCEYEICSILDGVLKFQPRRNQAVGPGNDAVITPFAQGDMVYAFMEGVDHRYRDAISAYLGSVLDEYPVALLKLFPNIGDKEKAELGPRFKEIRKQALAKFQNKTTIFGRQNHVAPVLSAVAILSKDMLAEVAESLVNLTSFKRRISLNSAETVGGPIDVAVISRGDGLVWIRRKHYFSPELNPHFLRNYFGDHYEEAKAKE